MVIDRKKQYKRQNEWNRKNRKRLSVVMTIEKAENVKRIAERYNVSVNAFINRAIDEYISQTDKQTDNTNGLTYR